MKRFSAVAAAASLSLAGLIVAGAGLRGPNAMASPAGAVGGLCNPTPKPTMSIGNDFVYENQVAWVQVTLTGPSCSTIKVDYNTSDGTADAGADYVAESGSLTFTPGQTSKWINVAIVDDDDYEPNEHFYVMLKHHVNVIPGDPTGQITISGLEPAG